MSAMPEWVNQLDPLAQKAIAVAGGLIVLLILVGLWRRWREALDRRRRRAELRRTRGQVELQQEELRRRVDQIIATSSTKTIAGFVILRQIEAVFAEGQRSPAEAVDALKAMAAKKGANAIINLSGERLPSGKCIASGDAVIVRPRNAPAVGPPGPASAPP